MSVWRLIAVLFFMTIGLSGCSDTYERNAGFYASAYNYDGETVISYRGTDQGSDIWTGWLAGLGVWSSPQVLLAADFYNALFPGSSVHGVTFTGHSLGGGLAGIMGSTDKRISSHKEDSNFTC